jgi:hypothetical protein
MTITAPAIHRRLAFGRAIGLPPSHDLDGVRVGVGLRAEIAVNHAEQPETDMVNVIVRVARELPGDI